MAESPKFFDPRKLAKLSGLRLRAQRIVEGYVAGAHRSPYRGFSIEFAEHREYAPGDDLRYLDWKVHGRTDKFYVKRFEDETNLITYIVLDTSRSMTFRSDRQAMSKLEYGQCLAASLAWLVLNQQDAVSLVTFDSEIRSFVRPGSSPEQMRQVISALESVDSQPKTNTGRVFHDLSDRFSKRGVVLIISDLFDDLDPMIAGLRHLRHRLHDVALLQLLDPTEVDFPYRKLTRFRGLEGASPVTADPQSFRRTYQKELQEFLTSVGRACRFHQADYRCLQTDTPFDVALSSYLTSRMGRAQ